MTATAIRVLEDALSVSLERVHELMVTIDRLRQLDPADPPSTPGAPFVCPVCDRSFPTPTALNEHRDRSHTPQPAEPEPDRIAAERARRHQAARAAAASSWQ